MGPRRQICKFAIPVLKHLESIYSQKSNNNAVATGASGTSRPSARTSGSAPNQTQAKQGPLKQGPPDYIEISDLEEETSEITSFLRLILELPKFEIVSKSEVTAGHVFYRWKIIREARDKMKSLGWLKRGVKNVYIVGASEYELY